MLTALILAGVAVVAVTPLPAAVGAFLTASFNGDEEWAYEAGAIAGRNAGLALAIVFGAFAFAALAGGA